MLDYTKSTVNGVLLLDKPVGYTSNVVLQRIKRTFNARKAGHTGTLDPFASGLLPVCFGEATKFSRFLLNADKKYSVSMQLGIKTTTGDQGGDVLASRKIPLLSTKILTQILNQFKGTIKQTPPMYSAIKYRGQPLYKYARKGIEINRQPRDITVYDLQLTGFSENILTLLVACSKGTYIRTLVEDIGEKLGCGAHTVRLRRLQTGSYVENQMVSYDQLIQLGRQGKQAALQKFLLPINSLVSHLPAIKLDKSHITLIYHGKMINIENNLPCGWVSICSAEDHFLGVGEVLENGRIAPSRLRCQGNQYNGSGPLAD